VVAAALEIPAIASTSPWCERPIDRLRDTVEAFASEDIDAYTADAVADDLIPMRQLMDRLEAEFARRVAHFERRGGPAQRLSTTFAFLRSNFNLTYADAMQQTQLATELPKLEGAEEAFRRGEITVRNASILARTVAALGADKVAPAAETLVDAAKRFIPSQLRLLTRHVRHCIDPDGALSDADRAYESRAVHLSQTYDGIFILDGRLDEEGGTLLRTALDALSKPRGRGDERCPSQRRADALVELAHRQLQNGQLPASGGQRPHLVVTVPLDTLRKERGCVAGDLGRGATVPAETARRIACEASLTEIVVDPASGEPLSVGRSRRTVPSSIRRALAVRDRGCRGCDGPVEWTEAHHRIHWADGGETKLHNLVKPQVIHPKPAEVRSASENGL